MSCSFDLSAAEIDEDSHVSAGIFLCCFRFARWTDTFVITNYDALSNLRTGSNDHLARPPILIISLRAGDAT